MKEPAPLATAGAELSVEDTLYLLRTRVLGATGRYAFLSKPFTAQQLLASVTQVLGSKGDTSVAVPPSQN